MSVVSSSLFVNAFRMAYHMSKRDAATSQGHEHYVSILANPCYYQDSAHRADCRTGACWYHVSPLENERGHHCSSGSRTTHLPGTDHPREHLLHLGAGLEYIFLLPWYDGPLGIGGDSGILRLAGGLGSQTFGQQCAAALLEHVPPGQPHLHVSFQ